MSLRVGHITYANCAPFFHHLAACGFQGRIVPGVPAQLNTLLAAGEIDLSPSSSFEYARNWRNYLLLPGHSISAAGPVRSVLLFSPLPLERLAAAPIELTGESATSVNLLKVLLAEFLGQVGATCRVAARPVEELIEAGASVLVIGDRALRSALAPPPGTHVYDLAELWWRFTGLPFVFALWIVRREAAACKSEQLRQFQEQLASSRARAFADLAAVAAATPERQWLAEQALVDYWRCMDYDLSTRHLAGLHHFLTLARRHRLLDELPELHFFA
jgi:chorismate dehydratase